MRSSREDSIVLTSLQHVIIDPIPREIDCCYLTRQRYFCEVCEITAMWNEYLTARAMVVACYLQANAYDESAHSTRVRYREIASDCRVFEPDGTIYIDAQVYIY